MNKNNYLTKEYNLKIFEKLTIKQNMRCQISQARNQINIRYFLTQPIKSQTEDQTPQRMDKLWQKTCFELFISKGNSCYREYNISPLGHWQCYEFTSYRSKAKKPEVTAPNLSWVSPYELSITIYDTIDDLFNAAVILHHEGHPHHYALDHGIKKADFHNMSLWSQLT